MTPDELATIQESERNACEEAHFNARPQIDMLAYRVPFRKGFDHGWNAALAHARQQSAEEIADLKAQVEGLRKQYNDLLFCVGNKYPGESRHDTAKRYLLERESPKATDAMGSKAIAQEAGK